MMAEQQTSGETDQQRDERIAALEQTLSQLRGEQHQSDAQLAASFPSGKISPVKATRPARPSRSRKRTGAAVRGA